MNIIEIEGHKVITDYLTTTSLVFDCGACVGDFTSKLYDTCKCNFNCYEPDPRNFRKLQKRFKEIDKIITFNKGISKEIGIEEFYLGKFITASSFFKSHRGLGNTTVDVPVTTIEEEIETYGLIDLLKLDLEGSEIDVIPLIPERILSKIQQITVEFHPQSKIEGYTQEKIDICRDYLKKQFKEISYVDKGNDGHQTLYLRKGL